MTIYLDQVQVIKEKDRIIFLDLMRAFAVIMMIQGHTVHTFLGEEYRTFESTFYLLWHTMRGFTAPIFMFTAGTVFTYLLIRNKLPFNDNPRVKIGIYRFASLLIIGYLLRFPTLKIFELSNVTVEQWKIFFSVDALHLIAFGIIFIIFFFYLNQKLSLNFYFLLAAGSIFFVLFTPVIRSFDWTGKFPLFIASYFTRDAGSIFPLFPWTAYLLSGGLLGYFIGNDPASVKSLKFSVILFTSGVALILIGVIIKDVISANLTVSTQSVGINIYRLGFVLILNGVVSYFAQNIKNIPNILKIISRHSLLIYVVHLIILYGCVLTPGLWSLFAKSFSLALTLLSVLIMLTLMTFLAVAVEMLKKPRKKFFKTKIIKV